ncbi:hypothetical protein [Leptospira vanthielii]|uniref:hypothetical protein n=1 Tax=Leptospira vanthielii TaxID=293085 RepID=UPI000587BDB6
MLSLLLIVTSLLILFSCLMENETKKKEETNKKNQIFLAIVSSSLTSDCIYCTNTQAFQGSCTCYSDISVGTCTGLLSGPAKSNSYKVTCEDITSSGVWQTTEDGKSSTCIYATCPPEAYRAAFTAIGM